MYTWVHVRGSQRLTRDVFLKYSPLCWDRVSRWTWNSLARVAVDFQGSSCLCFSRTGIRDVCCCAQLFCGCCTFGLRSSCLPYKCFTKGAIPQPLRPLLFNAAAMWLLIPTYLIASSTENFLLLCQLNILPKHYAFTSFVHFTIGLLGFLQRLSFKIF